MRSRWLAGGFFLLGTVLLTAGPSAGQPDGGKGGGKGGFGRAPDPEKLFGFLARGSGGEVIDFSKMDPNQRLFARGVLEKSGMLPPADNAVITKEAFVVGFNQAQAAKAAAAPPADAGQPPAPGGPPGGFGGRGPGGGMSDEDADRRFREYDRNQDGRLSFEEASERMKPAFKEIDTNGDGVIDLAEYKGYIAKRFGGGPGGVTTTMGGPPGGMTLNGPPGGTGQQNWNGPPGGWSNGQPAGPGGTGGRRDDKPPDDKAVVAVRFGKLPAGLPDWFADLDADRDGQVGLYEWRAAGKDMKEFMAMDLNGDGLLAPQELIRYAAQKAEQDRLAAAEEGGTTSSRSASSGGSSGGRVPGGGGMARNPWGGGKVPEKGSDGKPDKGGRNPWGGGKK